MSRSFQVETEKYLDFTAEELLNTFKTLRDSDKEIDFENIRIINHSEVFKTLVAEDCIVHMSFRDIEFEGKSQKWWSVGSRSMDGMGKNLFVACASALAIMMDGDASSGDGAFFTCTEFKGHELWETYLDSRPYLIVSTIHGDTVCRSTSEVIKIVSGNPYDDITISFESEYPQLSVLTNGKYACIHYFTENQTFQSVGDVNKEITFNAGGTEWTAPPEAVLDIKDAISDIEIFCDTGKRTDSIEEWTEL